MDVVIRIALVGLLCQIGFCLRILNVDQPSTATFEVVAKKGDNVTLKCQEVFESADENFGLNPLRWHKTQKEEEKEQPEIAVEVASLGQVRPDFSERIKANFNNQGTTVISVDIVIQGIQLRDSGWYFCYAKKGQEVQSIRYEVRVYEPPTDLVLAGKPSNDANVSSSMTGPLTFYSNVEDGSLECTAVGGHPAPTLRISIEGENRPLTGHGTPVTTYSLQGPIEGLQEIRYNTSIKVKVQLRPDQNGRRAICTATVDSDKSNTTSRTLSVQYPPKFKDCKDDWKAAVGDNNVRFTCSFESNPAPDVTWRALSGSPPTDIPTDGKLINNMYSAQLRVTSQMDSGNMSVFQTALTLKKVTHDSFHKYVVYISNDRGQVNKEFLLNQGTREVSDGNENRPTGSAGMLSSSPFLLLTLLTLAASFFRQ